MDLEDEQSIDELDIEPNQQQFLKKCLHDLFLLYCDIDTRNLRNDAFMTLLKNTKFSFD